MGVNRDLKKATEAYWGDKLSQADLLAEGKRLRLEHWKIQKDAGVHIIPSNDFSYYDHVLDHIQFFGVSIASIDSSRPMLTFERLFPRGTPSTSWIRSTSSLPWAAASRSPRKMVKLLLMFPVLCVSS